MRHLVKFSLLLSLIYLCKAGFSQQGTKDWEWEWAPIGAVWCYKTANMGSNAKDSYAQYWYVRSVKDTVYKSVNCRKLEVIRHYYPDFEPVKMQDRFTYQDGGDIYFYNADKGEFVLSFSYDLQRGDTVTWQMPMFVNCADVYCLDTILNWDAGYLSGAETQYTPNFIFMYSNTPIKTYRVEAITSYCFSEELSTIPNHGCGKYLSYFGASSDLFELNIIPEAETDCMCYYDGSVQINKALSLPGIYNDTIIYYKDSCRNYYNKFNNISSHIKENLFKVYPNPFTDFININLPASAGNCEIKVFDLMGKLIYSTKTHSNNSPLNLSQLVSGTYLIQIQTKQNIFTKRIIKN